MICSVRALTPSVLAQLVEINRLSSRLFENLPHSRTIADLVSDADHAPSLPVMHLGKEFGKCDQWLFLLAILWHNDSLPSPGLLTVDLGQLDDQLSKGLHRDTPRRQKSAFRLQTHRIVLQTSRDRLLKHALGQKQLRGSTTT